MNTENNGIIKEDDGVIKDDDPGVEHEEPLLNLPSAEEIMNSLKLNEVSKTDISTLSPEEKPLYVEDCTGVDADTMALYKEFGEFLIQKADIIENIGEKLTISTGIDILDAILGGGFAVGALNIIVGQPGSGKSMIAMQSIGAGQKQYNGMLAAMLDSEEATTSLRLSNLGVRNPKIKPITDITIEKVFKFLETMCVFKATKKIDIPSMMVWDSIANTLSLKEREAEDINSVIGYKARLLSILVPKFVAKCATHKICWVAVNQLRDEMAIGGPFSAPKQLRFMSTGKSMPGGNILKFNAFNLIEMKAKGALDPEKIGFDGIMTSVKTVKAKLFPPNVEIELIGSFVEGFSNFRTNWHFLAKNKRIHTGAWNYLPSCPEIKLRTKDAEIVYKENPKFKEAWDKAVKEAIEIDIIQKYNPVIK